MNKTQMMNMMIAGTMMMVSFWPVPLWVARLSAPRRAQPAGFKYRRQTQCVREGESTGENIANQLRAIVADGQVHSVELCMEIVESLKEQPGLDTIKVQWKAANTPERLRMVENGEADLECGTTSITLDRQETVDFSNEIFIETGGVLVIADSGIKGLVSLGDKKVAVIPGTTTEKRLVKALKRKHISARMVEVKDAKEGIEALDANKVDAYAGDQLTLIGQVSQSRDSSRFAMLTEQFSVDPYGLALPRGDADFRLAVNRVLASVYRDGAIEQIFAGAFGADAEPSEILKVVFLINAYPD